MTTENFSSSISQLKASPSLHPSSSDIDNEMESIENQHNLKHFIADKIHWKLEITQHSKYHYECEDFETDTSSKTRHKDTNKLSPALEYFVSIPRNDFGNLERANLNYSDSSISIKLLKSFRNVIENNWNGFDGCLERPPEACYSPRDKYFTANLKILMDKEVKPTECRSNQSGSGNRTPRIPKNKTMMHTSSGTINNLRRINKKLTNLSNSYYRGSFEKSNLASLRGGAPEIESAIDNHSTLFIKLQQYREKILNDINLERELDLYIEVRASALERKYDQEISELNFDIWKHFLDYETAEKAKVLLLTGQAGIGKSFFCKKLQREIMTAWNDSEIDWLPIYIDLSSRKYPKSEIINEILRQELSLTEEEILTVQTSDSGVRLLLIVDGYDEALNIYRTHSESMGNEKDLYNENFCTVNKIEGEFWKNTRFIVTCREENLQSIRRRDLFFAPLEIVEGSTEPSAKPGSFLQRKIEGFTDEQITSFFKKYCFYRQVNNVISEQPEMKSAAPLSTDLEYLSLSQRPPSWGLVDNFEKLIDEYKLREVLRIPLMLWIATVALHDTETKSIGCFSDLESMRKKDVSLRLLIKFFIDKVMQSMTHRNTETSIHHKEEDPVKQFAKQVQRLALRLNGYSSNKTSKNIGADDEKEDTSLLKACPLFEPDNSQLGLKFRCRLLSEFFVAKSIEEEIIEVSAISQEQKTSFSTNLHINQRLLTRTETFSAVILFLFDSLKDSELKVEHLLRLFQLLRQKHVENTQHSNYSKTDLSLEIAITNVITLLNAAKHDFSNHDFSHLNISFANLSYGILEGTKFVNSNIKGVNFTGAYLKNANFEKTNMEEIVLDNRTGLKLKDQQIFGIASPDSGEYVALDIGTQTAVFKNLSDKKFWLEETKRFPGQFPSTSSSPFSSCGKQIVTALDERLCVWDIVSGSCLKQIALPLHLSLNRSSIIKFNSGRKELFLCDSRKVSKFNLVSSNAWRDCVEIRSHIVNCDFPSNNIGILLVATEGHVWRGTSQRFIGKLRQNLTYCRFNPEGTLIVSGTNSGVTIISDSIRAHVIKSLAEKVRNYGVKSISYCEFKLHGSVIMSTTNSALTLQDTATAKTVAYLPFESELRSQDYALSPDGKQLAVIEDTNAVRFKNIDRSGNTIPPMKGPNKQGLNLKGAIMNSCIGLSEENIKHLQEKGDYGPFNEGVVKKLFPRNLTDAESVTEIAAVDTKLTAVHANIIGKDLQWINLRILDVSKNSIGDTGGVAICNNKVWSQLEAVNLDSTGIGDQTITVIASNPTWKNLKKLQLASNQISDIGAAEIGKTKLWIHLEVLDLHQNEIGNEGAATIGRSAVWNKLELLNMSSNKIDNTEIGILLCINNTWKRLKKLFLHNNPFDLREKEMLLVIKEIASEELEFLNLPQAKFSSTLLRYLKYIPPETVTEISLNEKGYNNMNALMIGNNSTWTNLKILTLSRNGISDKGGVKIGSNSSWFKLEVIDLSHNSLRKASGVAIGSNKTWKNLRELNLNGNEIGNEGARDLGKNTAWPNLQSLNLSENLIGSVGVGKLSRNSTWCNLQTLNLSGNLIGNEGTLELSKNTAWLNLKTLNLSRNSIDAVGATGLSKNSAWTKLQALYIGFNSVGPEGAGELAKNASWSNLQVLDLSQNSISDKGAEELGKNESWRNLQSLNLESNSIGPNGMRELTKNKTWLNLQVLNLENNLLGPKGAAELSRNVAWASIQNINLQNNSIGEEGAAALSKNNLWAKLHTLNLQGNSIGDKGVEELSKNKTWTNLRALNLQRNSISDKGAKALSKNTNWFNLQTLDLKTNNIKFEGAEALSKNLAWTRLETLILWENEIGAAGVAALIKNTTWKDLQTLDLSYSSIDTAGAQDLGRNKTWINLEALNLRANKIYSQGIEVLSKNETWTKLQRLNLWDNLIGPEGAKALSENTIWTNLQVLNLRSNNIQAEGARELGKNKSWIQLQSLNLWDNAIGAEGAAKLGENTAWTNLRTLDLSYNSIGSEGAKELSKNTSWVNLEELDLKYNDIKDKEANLLKNNSYWVELKKLEY